MAQLKEMFPGKAFSPGTVLTEPINSSATTITVKDSSVLPPAPNYLTIGVTEEGETIQYNAVAGNVLSGVIRGVGCIARDWIAGERVSRNFSNEDYQKIIDNLLTLNSSKVEVQEGKGLSTVDFTTSKDAKLEGIESNANKYTHPSSHPATIITQDSTHRFISDQDRTNWDKLRVYRGISELSLVLGSCTIIKICEAMSDNSLFIGDSTVSVPSSEVPPGTVGILEILRKDSNNICIRYQTMTTAGGTKSKTFLGSYRSTSTPKFDGLTEVSMLGHNHSGIYSTVETVSALSNMVGDLQQGMVDLSGVVELKADRPQSKIVTLRAANWTGSSAPYSITVEVLGVTANSVNEIDTPSNVTAEQLSAAQYANIKSGGQAVNSITLKAFGNKPTIDIPIEVTIGGDVLNA